MRARQAIAKAVNRQAIASSDLTGTGCPPTPLGNHLYLPGEKGYQDNSGSRGKYDPKAAIKGLEAMGWKVNGQKLMRGGQQMALKMVIPPQKPRPPARRS